MREHRGPMVSTSGGVQNTKKGLKIGAWSDESLEKALNTITDEGMKLKVASTVFGIPSSSVRDHVYGKTTSRQRGTQPTLKAHEEKKL